jgi:iron complex transport system substrate-binding protein
MRSRAMTMVLCGFLVVVIAASATAAPYSVTDTLGRTVQFPDVPSRIVLAGRATLLVMDAVYLFPEASRRVIAVGVTDQGLGDFFPFLDKAAASKTRLPNTVGAEQVAALKPDLVILKSAMKEKLGDPLSAAGITVLYVDLETPESFAADVQRLGTVFQQPDRAATVARWYAQRVDAVKKAVAGSAQPATIIAQYNPRDAASAFTVPPSTWIQATVAELAGATAAWKSAGPGDAWKKIGVEQLAAWNPVWFFVVSYSTPAAPLAEQVQRAGLVPGRIVGFPADYSSWDQADSRWILGLEWLAKTLHPERLASLDLAAEVRAFYGDLYGVDAATVNAQVLPRLAGVLAGR